MKTKKHSISNLAAKTTLNAKINKVKAEILNITNLATKTALNAVENKKPRVSNLVKKTDYNTKINEIEKKRKSEKFCCKIKTSKFSKQKCYCWFGKKTQILIMNY